MLRSDEGVARRSGFKQAVLASLHHQALARRHPSVRDAYLVEHLEIRLPARGRDDMAHIAALIVDELGVWLLLHASLERIVDVEAVAVRTHRGADELDSECRRGFVLEVLLELAGPVVVNVARERDQIADFRSIDGGKQAI